ncbi:MAG TPA: hypothetical protein VFZ01_19715 [Geminicoccaceae bacterium]
MRTILLATGLLLPLAAVAAPASETVLEASFDTCVQQCRADAAQAQASCEELCRCVTDEMSRAWDEQDFEARAAALESDPPDQAVVAEIGRFAERCTAR